MRPQKTHTVINSKIGVGMGIGSLGATVAGMEGEREGKGETSPSSLHNSLALPACPSGRVALRNREGSGRWDSW